MTTMVLPFVSECAVTSCSYNDHGCHAYAITIAGAAGSADCTAFVTLSTPGGLDEFTAKIGACTRSDCVHNADLECVATAVEIGPGPAGHPANCLTFAAG